MEKLIIEPGKGVGPFLLGMSYEEVNKLSNNLIQKYKQFIWISTHMDDWGKVNAINLHLDHIGELFDIDFLDINWKQSPEIIVNELKKIEPDFKEDGFMIHFPNWNISIANPLFVPVSKGTDFFMTINRKEERFKSKLSFEFIPHQSFGPFVFGMNKQEVQKRMKELGPHYENTLLMEYDGYDCLVGLEIVRDALALNFEFELFGVEILHTKANDCIEALVSKGYKYEETEESKQRYSFDFEMVGLSFWRSSVLEESDMEKDWFRELIKENQEDEKRFLYFETIRFYTNKLLAVNKDQQYLSTPIRKNTYQPNIEQTKKVLKENHPDITDEIIENLIKRFGR